MRVSVCVCIYLYTSYAHACTVYICTLYVVFRFFSPSKFLARPGPYLDGNRRVFNYRE